MSARNMPELDLHGNIAGYAAARCRARSNFSQATAIRTMTIRGTVTAFTIAQPR